MVDLVLKGRFVDPVEGEQEGCVGITNGVIETIGEKVQGKREIVLGEGQLVFPGFIDPHVHLREPGWEGKEDFLTGTKAAIAGGVTTVVDMPNNRIPTISRERVVEKMRLAEKALIDVFFHGGVREVGEIEQMKDVVKGYKVFLGETTGELVMSGKECETFGDVLGKVGRPVVFHVREPENDGIREALEMGERFGFPVHLAHLSTKEGLKLLKKASCEVTPHHLLFTEEDVTQNRYLTMKPPLGKERDRKALLEALKEGRIDMLATDHAPHLPQDKEGGAFGLPGLEVYGNVVAWLLKEGVDSTLAAKLTSFHAAQRFSLERRGRVKEGFFADLVVIDTESPQKISKPFKSKCGWSPYEGMEFPGTVSHTIVRGKVF